MGIITLGSGVITSVSQTPLVAEEDVKLHIDFPAGRIASTTLGSIPAGDRTQDVLPQKGLSYTTISGTLQKVVLMPGEIHTRLDGNVKALLNANPIARPEGKLFVATVRNLKDPRNASPLFAGQRVAQGDLFPVGLFVEGQMLAGLNAHFLAARADTGAILFQKSSGAGSLTLADPTMDGDVETVVGNFNISGLDTSGLPDDSEIEVIYRFYLDSGLGTVYQIETGSFTVYPLKPGT